MTFLPVYAGIRTVTIFKGKAFTMSEEAKPHVYVPIRASSFEDFEMNKLYLEHESTGEDAEGNLRRYYSDRYWYKGYMLHYGKESLPKFPELVYIPESDDFFALQEDFRKTVADMDIAEILMDESTTNKTLYHTLLEAPNGLYLTDPCYLTRHVDSAYTIPEGPWGIVVKGCHIANHSATSEDFVISTEDGRIHSAVVEGWGISHYSPAATTLWILRPRVQVATVGKRPVHYVSVDSGLAGVFPIDKNQESHWDDEFHPAASSLPARSKNEPTPSSEIYVTESGVFAPTTYGDGGFPVYELYSKDGMLAGYVVSFTDAMPHEEGEESAEWEESEKAKKVAEWNERLAVLEAKYADRGFTLSSGVDDLPRGTIDGMFFAVESVGRGDYLLRVGVVDAEYRDNSTWNYAMRGLTLLGEPYEPKFEENFPDRRLFSAIHKNPTWDNGKLDILDDLLSRMEPVPEERQLFGK